DLASDPELGLIYVLSRGQQLDGNPAPSPETIYDEEAFRHYMGPSSISLVHYERDSLADAAPMHGLGYFDLPQDLNVAGMELTDTQLYVTAKGLHFPHIDTQYEDKV